MGHHRWKFRPKTYYRLSHQQICRAAAVKSVWFYGFKAELLAKLWVLSLDCFQVSRKCWSCVVWSPCWLRTWTWKALVLIARLWLLCETQLTWDWREMLLDYWQDYSYLIALSVGFSFWWPEYSCWESRTFLFPANCGSTLNYLTTCGDPFRQVHLVSL